MSNPKRDPRDDTEVFSLGTVLVKMRAATREEIEETLREQERMSEDELLGALLVRRGIVTEEQLRAALEAQEGLRSRRSHVRALAAAELAARANEGVRRLASSVRVAVAEVRKKRTGEGYPVITAGMIAEKKDA